MKLITHDEEEVTKYDFQLVKRIKDLIRNFNQ